MHRAHTGRQQGACDRRAGWDMPTATSQEESSLTPPIAYLAPDMTQGVSSRDTRP